MTRQHFNTAEEAIRACDEEIARRSSTEEVWAGVYMHSTHTPPYFYVIAPNWQSAEVENDCQLHWERLPDGRWQLAPS